MWGLGGGTTNPGSKLFIGSGPNSGLTGLNVSLNGASYVGATYANGNTVFMGEDNNPYGIVGTLTNQPLGLRTNNTERVRIDTSGNVGIGTTAPSEQLEVSGNVKAQAFLYSSDYNLKKNITPISNQLKKVLGLQGVSFDWKSNNKNDVGFIAQEVEKVFPEVVFTNKETGLKSVDYAKLTVFLTESIKEQQKEIESLKAEIELLKR